MDKKGSVLDGDHLVSRSLSAFRGIAEYIEARDNLQLAQVNGIRFRTIEADFQTINGQLRRNRPRIQRFFPAVTEQHAHLGLALEIGKRERDGEVPIIRNALVELAVKSATQSRESIVSELNTLVVAMANSCGLVAMSGPEQKDTTTVQKRWRQFYDLIQDSVHQIQKNDDGRASFFQAHQLFFDEMSIAFYGLLLPTQSLIETAQQPSSRSAQYQRGREWCALLCNPTRFLAELELANYASADPVMQEAADRRSFYLASVIESAHRLPNQDRKSLIRVLDDRYLITNSLRTHFLHELAAIADDFARAAGVGKAEGRDLEALQREQLLQNLPLGEFILDDPAQTGRQLSLKIVKKTGTTKATINYVGNKQKVPAATEDWALKTLAQVFDTVYETTQTKDVANLILDLSIGREFFLQHLSQVRYATAKADHQGTMKINRIRWEPEGETKIDFTYSEGEGNYSAGGCKARLGLMKNSPIVIFDFSGTTNGVKISQVERIYKAVFYCLGTAALAAFKHEDEMEKLETQRKIEIQGELLALRTQIPPGSYKTNALALNVMRTADLPYFYQHQDSLPGLELGVAAVRQLVTDLKQIVIAAHPGFIAIRNALGTIPDGDREALFQQRQCRNGATVHYYPVGVRESQANTPPLTIFEVLYTAEKQRYQTIITAAISDHELQFGMTSPTRWCRHEN